MTSNLSYIITTEQTLVIPSLARLPRDANAFSQQQKIGPISSRY